MLSQDVRLKRNVRQFFLKKELGRILRHLDALETRYEQKKYW